MNRQRFLLLIAITAVAVVLVVLLGRDPSGGGAPAEGEPLLPGLDAVVNEVDAVDIVAPGGAIAVSLRRDKERWRVTEKDGYEAEFSRVVDLLRALSQARLAEPKTANSELYDRLGVQDVTGPDATGRRVDFPGREIPSVIVGQAGPTGEASYARRAGEAGSWLLDRIIEVPVDPVTWLEPGIMDIPSSDIARIVIRHPDGETVRLDRVGDDEPEFVLRDVPEGRSAAQPWKRNAVANGLRALNLEDVKRFEPPVPDDAVGVLFTTTDGLNFVVDLFEADGKYWAHFTASPENPASEAGEPAEVEEEEGTPETGAANEADDEGQAGDDAEKQANERLANAVAVDARLSPWLFAIPERRYNDLTKRMEDLLEPVEDEDES